MNRNQSPFKNALILCLSVFFSVQTHGTGKWREWASRFLLPFTTTAKTYKLEKKQRKEFIKSLNSMNDHQLTALDSELKSDFQGIGTIEEMKELTKKEIYARITQNEQGDILQILDLSLKAHLSGTLNSEKMAPHFFKIFQDAAKGNPPRAYRNILKEFFFVYVKEIMALGPNPAEIGILNGAIYSFDASMRILQESLDRASSANEFLSAFDAVAIPAPNRKNNEALNHFFAANAKKLGKLLSAEQAELMDSYINRTSPHDAKEATIKIRSETPNARNAWKYLRDIISPIPNPFRAMRRMLKENKGPADIQRGRARLFINFLKTWPEYLTLVDEKTGDNLLHMAIRHGKSETSREIGDFLLNAGLELEAKNKAGETALFIIGKKDITSPLFDYLKEKGAKTNATDFNGNTILHTIANQNPIYFPHTGKAIEKAIDSGISPYQKNHKGENFFMLSKGKSLSNYNDPEEIKSFWRRYVEENSEIPVDDLRLELIGREGEQKVSKASQCLRFVLALFKRKKDPYANETGHEYMKRLLDTKERVKRKLEI